MIRHVSHLHNWLAANFAGENWFRTAALLLLVVLAQACVSWPIRADWVFRRWALKRQELKLKISDRGGIQSYSTESSSIQLQQMRDPTLPIMQLRPETWLTQATQNKFDAPLHSMRHLRIVTKLEHCSLWALKHETTRESRPLVFGFTSTHSYRGLPVWQSPSWTCPCASAYSCHFVTSSLLVLSSSSPLPSAHIPKWTQCLFTSAVMETLRLALHRLFEDWRLLPLPVHRGAHRVCPSLIASLVRPSLFS